MESLTGIGVLLPGGVCAGAVSYIMFQWLPTYFSAAIKHRMFLHRDEWNKKLDEIFKQYNLGDGKYQKNYENIYDMSSLPNYPPSFITNSLRSGIPPYTPAR